MPEIQEFVLQAPTMMESHFHIKKESKDYQTWTRALLGGDELEFYLEAESIWLKATVHRVYIDDGSADAHFYLTWTDEMVKWKYVLHADLRVRVEAPTDDELIAHSVWCEGGDWYEDYNRPCSKHGKKYITQHGQSVWYCDEHKGNS